MYCMFCCLIDLPEGSWFDLIEFIPLINWMIDWIDWFYCFGVTDLTDLVDLIDWIDCFVFNHWNHGFIWFDWFGWIYRFDWCEWIELYVVWSLSFKSKIDCLACLIWQSAPDLIWLTSLIRWICLSHRTDGMIWLELIWLTWLVWLIWLIWLICFDWFDVIDHLAWLIALMERSWFDSIDFIDSYYLDAWLNQLIWFI